MTKDYFAPSSERYIQPIQERRIINTKEEVKFVPTEEQIVNLNPIAKEPIMREYENNQTVVAPGREIYRDLYVQPLVQRENVKLNIERGDD